MKKIALVVLLAALAVPAKAVNGPFGLGVVLGEPTGITGKYWLDRTRQSALDFTTAWSLSGENEFHLHGDYLFHNYRILQDALHVTKGKLPLYFGIGARVKFREHDDDRVGIRLPIGAAYQFDGAPLEAFLEVAPIVDLAPDTDLSANGGIGIRFFF